MFYKNTPYEKTGLEKAIDEILAQMDNCISVDSEEYRNMSNELEKLYKLKEIDQKAEIHKRVGADTAVKTGGLLLGIGVIVFYEQKNVLGSKAMSLVQKFL